MLKKASSLLMIDCVRLGLQKVLIFSAENGNPRRPWQYACYEFLEKPVFGVVSASDAANCAPRTSYFFQTIALPGQNY